MISWTGIGGWALIAAGWFAFSAGQQGNAITCFVGAAILSVVGLEFRKRDR